MPGVKMEFFVITVSSSGEKIELEKSFMLGRDE